MFFKYSTAPPPSKETQQQHRGQICVIFQLDESEYVINML